MKKIAMKSIAAWFESRINPYPENLTNIKDIKFWSFIGSCIYGIRIWLFFLIVLTAGLGIFEAYLFRVMSQLVDWLTKETPQTFWQNKLDDILIIGGIFFLSVIGNYLHANLRFLTLQGAFPMRLRWQFHRLLLEQSLSFYQDEFAGRISTKVMQTALAVREVVMTCSDMFVFILIYLFSIGVILVSFEPWMLAPFVAWLLIYIFMLIYFVPKITFLAQTQANARSLMTGRITDAYANIATVKLFSHSSREADYAKQAMEEFLLTVNAQMRLVVKLNMCNHCVNIGLFLAVLLLGIGLWQDNLVSVGAVAASAAMAVRLHGLSQWIMWESAGLFENIGTVRDGISILSKQLAVQDIPEASELKVTNGTVEFENVNFTYGQNKSLFDKFNLKIKPGEKIGIVGRSGAGKTSLVNLLLRFYDVDGGKITIDGQDISKVTQNSLRAKIGMVTQDISLLHRTVRENILYGDPNATEQDMILAATQAHAAEFIEQLRDQHGNQGYDVLVGERGIKLSGGQRQRIAIARVMLKNAPILLLDEATSALDSEIEAAIQDSLDQLMQNKTVIAIAHRLSTIAAMDRLVVVDEGVIVEVGSHSQLLANDALYAQLWSRQSGGFLADDL